MKKFMEQLMDQWKNPPAEARPVPFWSWNDNLEPDTLRYQIGEMKKAGLGGYFMHARGGLETEYMSGEWMECVETCMDEGKKTGLHSWCYDENGWPSGFAGGLVPALGEEYHVRWMELEEITDPVQSEPEPEQVLGIYALRNDGRLERLDNRNRQTDDPIHPGVPACGKTSGSEEAGQGERRFRIMEISSPYYIDILNKKVVRAFLDFTHEKYCDRFREEFGTGIKGFFTDEPQFRKGKIPWSHILPGAFREKYGYDPVNKLPALFLRCEGYETFRYDFWSLVNELYTDSFAKQIYDWCEEHNCMLTGHTIQEGSMYNQMTCSAGVAPFYEYMHIPGIDWLGRRIDNPVVPKQVSSVANQTGKKKVLTETYGGAGWNISFEELKWIAEWQLVNGVNLLCPHLEAYSLRGLRKRDYPPSLFLQQPWWEEYRYFTDTVSRLGMLLSTGRNIARVLLIHPMKSGWIAYNNTNNEELRQLDKDFVWATETLAGLHFDHHYGDETIIGRHGYVKDGLFGVGQCGYPVVVLPSMRTIDRKTVRLLEAFLDNGGLVVSVGDLPTLCEGKAGELPESFTRRILATGKDREQLKRVLEGAGIRSLSIRETEEGTGEKTGEETGDIRYQQRIPDDAAQAQVFYLVNHSREKEHTVRVRIFSEGSVKEYLPESGETQDLLYRREEGRTVLPLTFLPMQSHVLLFEGNAEPSQTNTEPLQRNAELPPAVSGHPGEGKKEDRISVIRPASEWEIEKADGNALTLDDCRYRADEGEWEGPVPVFKAMEALLRLRRPCRVALQYEFEMDADPDSMRELYLVLETPEQMEISVNGHPVRYQEQGWWIDRSFKKVDIRSLVKRGRNEVLLKRDFYQSKKVYDYLFGTNVLETERNKLTYDVEPESIYILGDFGVISKTGYVQRERNAMVTHGPFVITEKPVRVKSGDLTQQGFCFFAGNILLKQELVLRKKAGERILLDLGKPDAILSKLFVNGKEVKTIAWAPYTADITDYVSDGDNDIELKLYGSNRNLLGPHHHVLGENYRLCPASFSDKPGWAEEEQGLKEIWAEGYCFVKFGLPEVRF